MKKFLRSFIVTVVCLSMVMIPVCPVYAEGDSGDRGVIASGTCGENLTWTLDEEGLLTISGEGEMTTYYDSAFNVPWSAYKDEIKKVMICDGVTTVGYRAFHDCTSLTSIDIPESVIDIGFESFKHCASLTKIIIPESVTCLEDSAFFGCSGLTKIIIPESVTRIENNVFTDCTSLTTVLIPESVTYMHQYGGIFANIDEQANLYVIEGSYADEYIKNCEYAGMQKYVTKDGEHYWYGKVTTESTCTTKGITTKECIACGEKIEEQIPALGHSIVKVEAKAATLREDGNIEYCLCERCGKCFSDADGINELSAESVVIPKTGGEIIDSGTCGANGDNLTWTLYEEGLLTIEGQGQMDSWYNPSGVPWNGYDNYIKSVDIKEGVSSIGYYTFDKCYNLERITIPASVVTIENMAFNQCSSLKDIVIPENVTTIGGGVFSQCSNLVSITIPESVTSIEGSAFSGCSSLTTIMIPESVTSIGDSAFYECSSLTSITIPIGVDKIGYCSFAYCSSLEAMTIPESVSNIDGYAFSGCESLKAITIPKSVNRIGEFAFQGCNSLSSVTICNGVTEINKYAFAECRSLTSISIPKSVTKIGESAFSNCCKIKKVYVNDLLSYLSIDYGDLGSKPNWFVNEDIELYINGELETDVVIPEGITCIDNYAFKNYCNIRSITIPDGVKVGDFAFSKCNGLTSIIIPKTVTSIGVGAFSECGSLTNITLPDGLTDIGDGAFCECSSLTSLTIPEGVANIGENTFGYCSNLRSITLPRGINNIGDYAFVNCSSLIDVTIPDGVTNIGNHAFSDCSSLTGINIPESMTKIGESVFSRCRSLTSIKIPENVKSIGSEAFSGCTNLKNVIIPESVISIGDRAFLSCSSLTNIMIPQGVSSIGDYSFLNCSSLEKAVFPESVTSIGRYAVNNISNNNTIYVFPGSFADSYFSSYKGKTYLYYDGASDEKYINAKYESIVIKQGDIITASDYYDTNIASIDINCSIEDESLFIYDSGKIASLSEGETYLILYSGDVSERIKLICKSETAEVLGISLKDNALELEKGQSITEQISFAPNNAAGKEVTWSSSNESVVSVTGGRIKAEGSGSATVKVALTDNPEIFDTCEVTVINPIKDIVTFDDVFYNVQKGSRQKLAYYIYPYDTTDIIELSFSSNDSETVSIDENGYLTAHKNGVADVTVSAGDITKTVTVTVYNPLRGIRLDKGHAQVICGDMVQLNVLFEPEDTTEQDVLWTSSNEELAKVDKNGMVSIKGKGIATVTATAGNYSDTCYIVSADHSWDKGYSIDRAPTCHEEGIESIHCTNCGKIKEGSSRVLAEVGHSLARVEAKEATFRDDGNIEYWYCQWCGKCFSDAEGTNELSAESVVIPKTGGEIVDSGTCGANGDNLAWSLDEDGVLVISGTGDMYDYTTSGSYSAPWDKKLIKQVIVEKGVSKLGRFAFDSCVNLENVMISDRVVSLGYCGFMGCTSLTSVSLPESLTSIDYGAFWDCSNLERIEIPESVTQIEYGAFNGCYNLKNVTIPESVTSIGGHAFEYCKKLSMITIPDSVTLIDSYAFAACDDLEKVVISNNVTSIGDFAFSSCTGLKDVVIPKSVTSIGLSTFYNCYSLNSVMIPESVTDIGASVFSVCPNLSNVYVIKDSYADTWIKDNGYSEKIKYVYESGDHYFYDTLIKATCTAPGSRSSLCVVCGEEITESIPATGHDLTHHEAKEPTCTEVGWNAYDTCSRCNHTTYAEIPSLGHSWCEWILVKRPSYTEEGIERRVCDRDASHFEERSIEKLTPSAHRSTWVWENGKWHYYDSDGYMKTGWLLDSGKWYYMDTDGVMQTGLHQVGGTKYYFNSSGAMQTGWQSIGGSWYYFNSSGAMQVSKWIGSYYVKSNGCMAVNEYTPDGYYVGSDGICVSNYTGIVYWVEGGFVYHLRRNCPTLSRSTNILSGTIEQSHKSRACKDCS